MDRTTNKIQSMITIKIGNPIIPMKFNILKKIN